MSVRIESHAEPIPGYRLIERLGGGGFGEVWKATAPGGLLKAIKFVYGDLQTAQSEDGVRAEQELKAMSRVKTVRHPYILSLERFDIIDGQLIIVMELADRNLWDRFRECQAQGLVGIPREELLGYMAEIAEALDLMNQEFQLQHLDIKPQNLFLVHNHVKVADFGLVKDLEGMVASVTGGVTPVYAAPETFDGWVSRYCDQYSLAIVYQELLTGKRPFAGNNVRQLILQHLQAAPDLSPLPVHDRDAIGRALAKSPDDRHPFCKNLVDALRGHRGQGSSPLQPDEELPSRGDVPSRPVGPEAEPPASCSPVTYRFRGPADASGNGVPQETPGPKTVEPSEADTPSESEEIFSSPRPILKGEGLLFPALIIGLGSAGREVLKRISAHLTDRFGTPLALPQVRMLYIDTDPDAVRLAAAGKEDDTLRRGEVLFTPLHRPSHYLNPRQGKLKVDSWLDTKMLYRIPRQASAAGVRALGRLALVDNIRPIALRLRRELQECTDPAALAEAAHQTGLGMRRDDPRVYVVSSLAGGTGSGMFLDLAYVVRTLLRQMGFPAPDVVGLFLLPPADPKITPTPTLANAYAALTELHHYSLPETTFAATYDSKDNPVLGPVSDPGSPFQRCFFLPFMSPRDASSPRRPSSVQRLSSSLALACNFLLADLTTPLGRSADRWREEGTRDEGRGAREEDKSPSPGASEPAAPGPDCPDPGSPLAPQHSSLVGTSGPDDGPGEERKAPCAEASDLAVRSPDCPDPGSPLASQPSGTSDTDDGEREESKSPGADSSDLAVPGPDCRDAGTPVANQPCALVGTNDANGEAREENKPSCPDVADLAASGLDLGDADSPRAPQPSSLVGQTFGLFRLIWPRRALVRQTARRVCKNLVEQWMSKDSKPVTDKVQKWVKEQWEKQELGADHLIGQLQEAGDKALRSPVESVMTGLIEPLTVQVNAQAGPDLDLEVVPEIMNQFEQLLGRSHDKGAVSRPDKASTPGKLEDALRTSGDKLALASGHKLAELAVCLIEEPGFRLAGAEEAIRQMTILIEQTLQHHEEFSREIAEKTREAHANILGLLKTLRAGSLVKTPPPRRGGWFGGTSEKPIPAPQQLLEQLRTYAKSRYQLLILQQVTTMYVSLRGQLSDQMREVGFCRSRLLELARSFDSGSTAAFPELEDANAGLARVLLPPGCKDLAEAVDRQVEAVQPPDLEELDRRIEVLIRKDFTALVEVCLGSANQLKTLEAVMQHEAEAALAGRLAEASAVDMFLSPRPGSEEEPEHLQRDLEAAFEKAEPELTSLLADSNLVAAEGCDILTCPAGGNTEALKDLVRKALPNNPVLFVTATEARAANEILIYRETPVPSLADLELLGPNSRDAYLQMTRVDHYTPHTRLDIPEWVEVSEKEAVAC